MPSKILWPLPPHTIGKHDVLTEYLKAWVPILGQGFGRAVVVDGFAGPGQYAGGAPGSPILSWRVARDHKAAGRLGPADIDFRFLEVDAAKAEHLRDLLAREQSYSGMSCSVEAAACGDRLPSLLDECRSSGTPVFVMLDPFGLKGVTLDLIGDILSVPHGEVLFSFMHETAVRFGETPEVHPYLMELVGEDCPAGSSIDDYCDALEQRFRSHGARYVLKFGLWQGGRHVYTLFFGTCSSDGCEKMKDAMWKVAQDDSYRFDGIRRRQPLLLSQDDYGFAKLAEDLVSEFAYDRWVQVDDLDVFMQGDQTLFRKAHLRSKVLAPLQKKGLLNVRGPQPRRGSFPAERGIEVMFLQRA